MKYTLIATAAAILVGAVATSHTANARPVDGAGSPAASVASSEVVPSDAYRVAADNTASLNALLAAWDRAGFNAPSKPGQYRVYGRNGYVTSGPEYNAMASLIRAAVSETRQGRDGDAAGHIALATSLLASVRASGPATTAAKA